MIEAIKDDMKLIVNLSGTITRKWDEMTPGVRLAYLEIMQDTIAKLQRSQEAAE